MEAYQGRVVEEKRELDEKLERLSVLIGSDRFQELSVAECKRLVLQFSIMQEYARVLGERISAFMKEG